MASKDDRKARIAEVKKAQKKAESRSGLLIVGGAALIGILIVGGSAFALIQSQQEKDEIAAAAEKPIDGVEEYDDLSRNHVDTAVSYPQNPPVGGDHNPVWTNCGVYDGPVVTEQAVHSLEHGAVWIAHQPDLEQSELDTLVEVADSNSYVLLSPVEGIESPIVLTAWGVQLAVDSADDPRVETFVAKYQQGPQTPEPGAACTGGAGGM